MTPETVDKASHWLIDLFTREKIKEFKIHFIGGEPMISFNSIIQTIDTITPLLPEGTKPNAESGWLTFTNGDLLTIYKLEELRKRHVRVSLNPTYDSLEGVEKKIKLIKSICSGTSLAIALDWKNLKRLPDLTRLAIKYHCHMRINRLYHGGSLPGYVSGYKRQMKEMFELLLQSNWIMWPNFIMESFYPTWKGEKNPYSCGKWFFTIEPDGSIRSCNADLETVAGHIDTCKSLSDIKFHQRWSAKNLPECQGCEWITWCQGGCPFTRKITYGTYNQKSPFCEAFKELFPMLMELTKRWEARRQI
jgi:radical SAM protein with 4Fe4S-binding SPASM domain